VRRRRGRLRPAATALVAIVALAPLASAALVLPLAGVAAVAAAQPPPEPQAEAQIVGGSNTMAPEVVRITTRFANGVIDVCTGTFISDRWVLTAAHCLQTESGGPPSQPVASIRVESTAARFDATEPTYWTATASTHAVHPSYRSDAARVASHDLGLVRVDQAAPGRVSPVGLVAASTEPAWGAVLVPGTFSATGTIAADVIVLPDRVQIADVVTTSTAKCAAAVASTGEQFSVSDAFCTAGAARLGGDSADVCFGDSGGALIVSTVSGRRVAAGVASAGVSALPCVDSLAVFSRLGSDAAWITSVTGIAPVAERIRVLGDPSTRRGYWLLERDGGVSSFGGAPVLGAVRIHLRPGATAVALAARPQGDGYWVLASDGDIIGRGAAAELGGVDLRALTKPDERVTTLSAAPDGNGVWVFTSAGRVISFGSALPAAHMRGAAAVLALTLQGPVVDSMATPTGRGAYLVAADGGLFALGDASFRGSLRGVLSARFGPPGLPHQPIVGVVADPDGDGYWMVGADGGVFSFNAPFRGSLPAIVPFHLLAAAVDGMVPYGAGYLLVASDGGVFNFSNLPFAGSGAGRLDSPVVDIATAA
jgi:secreted trypsin-like serine protease